MRQPICPDAQDESSKSNTNPPPHSTHSPAALTAMQLVTLEDTILLLLTLMALTEAAGQERHPLTTSSVVEQATV